MNSDSSTREIVVGIDGSPQALSAVRWAAEEARLRRSGLRLVTVLPRWMNDMPDWSNYAEVGRWGREDADRTLAEARAAVQSDHPDLVVVCERRGGDTCLALVEAAGSADLLVVGTHGAGGFVDMLLGSVATAVAARSEGPVVVHREAPSPEPRGRVVLGVDLSTGESTSRTDDAAIMFAVAEAQVRRADLELLTVAAGTGWPHPKDDHPHHGAADIGALRQRISDLSDQLARHHRPLAVTGSVMKGHPVDALVAASLDTDLLVIGRGDPRSGLRIGSVARGVMHHAKSSVAVIPRAEDAG